MPETKTTKRRKREKAFTATEKMIAELEHLGKRQIRHTTEAEWKEYNAKVKALIQHMQEELHA